MTVWSIIFLEDAWNFRLLTCLFVFSECGLTYVANNLRIVGGSDALAHSWPSTVLVSIAYRAIVKLDKDNVFIKVNFKCGGSLIDRRTVLTAGHCIIKQFEYDYGNKTYVVTVTPNDFHPTIGSIYKVFVGADRTIDFDVDIAPSQGVAVRDVILVSLNTALLATNSILNDHYFSPRMKNTMTIIF